MASLGYSTLSFKAPGRRGSFVDFGGSSIHSSQTKKVFKGRKCGQNCISDEEFVAVKVIGEVKGVGEIKVTEKRCDLEISKAAEVARLAERFHNETPSCPTRVSVEVPSKTQVDELAAKNRFKSRPLQEDEWVLVETFLPGTFLQFSQKNGQCQNGDFPELECFAHFCYHVTQGSLVVCGLQGVCNGRHFRLVSPTLHSVNQSYGPCDRGQEGIADFFRHHVCSEACRDWLRPETVKRPLEEACEPRQPSAPIFIPAPPAPGYGFPWGGDGGSDDIDFSPWSTIGPFGSPLTLQDGVFLQRSLLRWPPLQSPTGSSDPYWRPPSMLGSPPPAYQTLPGTPNVHDVGPGEHDEKSRHRDLPPDYEDIFPLG